MQFSPPSPSLGTQRPASRAFLRVITSPPPGSTDSVGIWLWVPAGLYWLVGSLLFLSAGFTVATSLFDGLATYGTGIVAAYALLRLGKARPLSDLIIFNSYLTMIGSAGMMMAYAAATVNRPLVDPVLIAIDRTIGYDWAAYAGLFASHGWLARLILPAYHIAYIVPCAVITCLILFKKRARTERYLLAIVIAATLTAALFTLFPARTAWGHLGIAPHDLAAYKYLPLPTEGWERDLLAIRAGAGRMVAGGNGLIAFPSFHCATALLAIWAIWPTPFAVRIPVVAINVASLFATPIVGGHYAVDMIGGAMVALAGIGACHLVHDRLALWRAGCARLALRMPSTEKR